MKANKAGAETIAVGREMGRDEGKYILREAVDGNERVSPFADSRRDGCNILIQLRKPVEAIAAEEVRKSISRPRSGVHNELG